MNKFSSCLVILVSIFVATTNVFAAKTPILRDDGNIDAGARIMKVYCPSGKRTTIRLYFEDYDKYKRGQTCAYAKDGSDICRANWDHDAAAVEACNQM